MRTSSFARSLMSRDGFRILLSCIPLAIPIRPSGKSKFHHIRKIGFMLMTVRVGFIIFRDA